MTGDTFFLLLSNFSFSFGIGATNGTHQQIQFLLCAGFLYFVNDLNNYHLGNKTIGPQPWPGVLGFGLGWS